MSVTIHDVAREAGVSVKTVSRAMNNHPDVSAATREAVREVARRLNYHPSPVARGLRGSSTGLVALLVPDILNPHFAEYARHMQAVTHADGLLPIVSSHDDDPEIALANLRAFVAHRVDGLVWFTEWVDRDALEFLRDARLPTVITLPNPTMPPVALPEHVRTLRFAPGATTYEQATRAAVDHLLGLGHRTFAYITESPGLVSVRERIAGFRGAAGHLPTGSAVVRTHPDLQSGAPKPHGGYETTMEMLAEGYRPTAVLASSDMVALGVLRALREWGFNVPADVSVVGCDDVWEAAYTDPPLTTLRAPYEAVCAAGLGLLRHLIDPEDRSEAVCEMGHELVIRASTGPAPEALEVVMEPSRERSQRAKPSHRSD